jgi:hypothetical protein
MALEEFNDLTEGGLHFFQGQHSISSLSFHVDGMRLKAHAPATTDC